MKRYLIIGVIIVGILMGGFFLFNNFIYNEKQGGEANGMPGWKTYRNSAYNFSVKYPSDWNVLTEEPPYISPLKFQGYDADSKRDFFGFNVEDLSRVGSAGIQNLIDLEVEIYERFYGEGSVEITQDTRNTSSSKMQMGPHKKRYGETLYESTIYWLILDDSIRRVQYEYPIEDRGVYKPIFMEMFSTFEFAGESASVVFDFTGQNRF
ncbi:hypothetical protein IID24_04210 [Patescibacteria group bacterium]|nr:hypothetical protein [Patescibacteria group bacterium]